MKQGTSAAEFQTFKSLKMSRFNLYLFIFQALFIINNQVIGQDNEIDIDQFRDDWSIFNVTSRGLGANPSPMGGILIQWTQEGLDYVAKLAKLAFNRLLTGIQLPDNKDEENGFSATNIRVREFSEPQVFIRFLHRTGIGAKVLLPKLEIAGDYEVDTGWMGTSRGKVRAFARNLVIQVLLDVERGPYGHPTFGIPYCDAKMGSFRIAFSDTESFAGSMLNSFRAGIESFVSTQMGDMMCMSARNMTSVFEELFIDPWSGPSVMDPDVMCPNVTIDPTAAGPPQIEIPKTGSAIADRLLERVKGFSVDIRLSDETVFDNDRVVLALKGDFYYENNGAPLKPKRIDFPKAKEMLKFAVTEHVPDVFLYHVFERNLAYVEEKLEMQNLPARIRGPVRLLCWNCHLKILAAPNEPPKIRMTTKGVQVVGKGWVKVTAHGFFHKFNVIAGTAEIVADLSFRVTNNVIYGNLTMGRPKVQVSSSGLAGLVAATLAEALEELIQKKVWPKLYAPVHDAIGVKGIQLPEVCGLSFNNTAISFFDGFVSVGTDLVYDMDGFLTRFLKFLDKQRAATVAGTATEASTHDN